MKCSTVSSSFAATMLLLALTAVSGCKKTTNANSYTAENWIRDPSLCVRNTAAAIIDSKMPWPNEIRGTDGRVEKFDAWYGTTRYRFSVSVPIVESGFYPKAHPYRYTTISGDVSRLLGRDSLAVTKNVPMTISGHIFCITSQDGFVAPQDKWAAAKTRDEAITRAVENISRRTGISPNIRLVESIDMLEIDAGGDMRIYFPRTTEIRQASGGKEFISGIVCNRYAPEADFDASKKCRSWVSISPGIWAEYEIYQQLLPLVPAIHNKFIFIFSDSKAEK